MQPSNRTNPFINRKPLTTGTRETFLARIRKSLGHSPDASPPPQSDSPYDESLIRQVAANDPGLIDRFIAKAKSNTMVVHRVPAESAAIQAALGACLANHKISKTALNAAELDAKFQLTAHLAQKNITVVPWTSPDCRQNTFDCHASITDCRGAIADTGSILVYSDPTFGRTTTLVVPVHIVLLPISRILPDMIDAFAQLRRDFPQTLPSNIVVITGPSKTGDIEMKLVTGVHGPKFMYLILIDGI